MRSVRERLTEESGYSMVEVVVAILLLSIAIIPMVSMFDAGLRAAVLGGNYDLARTTATGELENIKALPYEEAVNDYPPGTTTSCTGPISSVINNCQVKTRYAMLGTSGITLEPSARSMMQVEVTVAWDGGNYKTTGLISKDAS